MRENENGVKLKYICSAFSTSLSIKELITEKAEETYPVFGAAGVMGYMKSYNSDKEYLGIIKDGAGVGRINKYPAYSSLLGTMTSIVPNNGINIDWLKYAIDGLQLGESIDKTTIPHIYFSVYGNRKVRDIDSAQQKKIADFLDTQVAKVDTLISNQEKQIENLKAYKQSLITETVTKGLDPSVPMKDSSVEWIGEIPEGWNILPIKSLFEFGKGLPITKENLKDSGMPVISYGQIHSKINSGTTTHKELIRYVSEDYLKSNTESLVKKGDFIFADTSEDREGCGNCAAIDVEYKIFGGYHTILLKANNPMSSRYLSYLFRTDHWRTQIRSKVSGVKLFSISKKILGATTVVLPSPFEQNQIAAFLDKKCTEIDKLISIKQSKIEKLNEYKKSLIYEYVTGKKEVM